MSLVAALDRVKGCEIHHETKRKRKVRHNDKVKRNKKNIFLKFMKRNPLVYLHTPKRSNVTDEHAELL